MDKFIQNLCQEDPKCQVIWPWWKRLLFWALFVLSGMAVILWMSKAEVSITHGTGSTWLILEFCFMVLSGVLATYSAFKLCVPGRSLFLDSKIMLLPFFAWALSLLGRMGYELFTASESFWSATSISSGLPCSAEIVVLALLPGAALFFLIRRAMAIRTLCISYFTFLSVLVVGATVVHTTCPVTQSLHMFLWHFLPVFLLSCLGVAFSRWFRCCR